MQYVMYDLVALSPLPNPSLQKGFGTETPDIQGEIEKFFNSYGRASAVRMRRIDSTKEFKVSTHPTSCI